MLKLYEDVQSAFRYKDISGLSGGESHEQQGSDMRFDIMREYNGTKWEHEIVLWQIRSKFW